MAEMCIRDRNRFINQFQVTGDNKNVCGLYGYTTFNAVKYFEHIPVSYTHLRTDCIDGGYLFYDFVDDDVSTMEFIIILLLLILNGIFAMYEIALVS